MFCIFKLYKVLYLSSWLKLVLFIFMLVLIMCRHFKAMITWCFELSGEHLQRAPLGSLGLLTSQRGQGRPRPAGPDSR